MQELLSKPTVLDEVGKAVAEAIEVELSTVAAESSLTADLGAESLDCCGRDDRLLGASWWES